MPFLAVPVSFLFKDVFTHGNFDFVRLRERLREMWLPATYGMWLVWIPLESFNLRVVPLRYRVTFSGFISFCWMVVTDRSIAPRPVCSSVL